MSAYYNENDRFAAAWLKSLIAEGVIAHGEVDERSIADVEPKDLQGFTQHHFFAGIGVWSYALRAAGWPDELPVWTGSCPCQSFSASGKRGGFSDQRHLWPPWSRLIGVHRPVVIFGEQVASKDGLAWFDIVSSELEAAGYTVWATDLCAAGLGAPHIRQRLYFVAHTLAHGRESRRLSLPERRSTEQNSIIAGPGQTDGLADADRGRREQCNEGIGGIQIPDTRRIAGPANGFWRDAIWIPCKDGTLRPTQPAIFPLVDGSPNRVGLLRGAGNAIVAPVAQAFIEAFLEVMQGC